MYRNIIINTTVGLIAYEKKNCVMFFTFKIRFSHKS